jgi:hypothetical protein
MHEGTSLIEVLPAWKYFNWFFFAFRQNQTENSGYYGSITIFRMVVRNAEISNIITEYYL